MTKFLRLFLIIFSNFIFISCNYSILEAPIPKKCPGYCLTFDDCYVQQWGEIQSLLDSNNVHATFFVTDVSILSKGEVDILHNLQKAGNEIGCHSLKHLNPLDYLKTHSVKEYIAAEIIPALNNLSNVGIYPTSFAFPYGLTTDSLNNSLFSYFKILRTVAEEQRYNHVENADSIESIYYKYDDKRTVAGLGIDKNFDISIDQIKKAFQRVKSRNEVVVFYAHCPVSKVTASYQIEKKYIKELVNAAKSFGLKNYNLSEL